MVALIRPQAQQWRGNGTRRPRRLSVAEQPPRPSLLDRMAHLHQQIATWQCPLTTIGTILRDDVVLWPLQCEAITEHLALLRQQAQAAQNFYSRLDPQAMRRVAPDGTLVKLHWLDEQLTELLLLLGALRRAFQADPCTCVELHLLARQGYPAIVATFDDVVSQLAALVEKAQEVRA